MSMEIRTGMGEIEREEKRKKKRLGREWEGREVRRLHASFSGYARSVRSLTANSLS